MLKTDYIEDSFSLFDDKFHTSGQNEELWKLIGDMGSVEITLEKYEGYYFSLFMLDSSIKDEAENLIHEITKKQDGQ